MPIEALEDLNNKPVMSPHIPKTPNIEGMTDLPYMSFEEVVTCTFVAEHQPS
jgi:hypothetical protein